MHARVHALVMHTYTEHTIGILLHAVYVARVQPTSMIARTVTCLDVV